MNNGIHTITIIKFLNKYFDEREHAFVFPFIHANIKDQLTLFKNIFYIPIYLIPFYKSKKIIFHGLFTREFIDFLYINKFFLKKSYWFIWGGDLYRNDDSICSYVKSNFAGVLTSFDDEKYREKFGINKFYDVTYPTQMIASTIDLAHGENNKKVKILINNSADITTLEMLGILLKFKNENIEIYTILSYVSSNQDDLRLQIMKTGYELFENKFKPIIEFMEPEEYSKFLRSINIYISNQDRAQGNGNASYICAHGGKVYVKSTSSIFKKYNSIGIKYFPTEIISYISFSELLEYDDNIKRMSISNLRARMDDKTKFMQWDNFFKS